ncbi:sensor histidine kinase [Alcanivorax sp. 1008]|uniref:sensor histidine kinase n=1 Tax=Alcanivorax sp. 1008 TaxID=2816853 RepID=UPI001DD331D4|nr:sensor histidine kinase [Alcanivorax sp. 1008]MCC1497371.1 sensor histidine kinase [Alcanivorax sp. 1008]
MFNPSPRLTVTLSGLLALCVLLLSVSTALSLPWTGISWSVHPDGGLTVQSVDRHGPNAATFTDGMRATGFQAAERYIDANAVLLIEEPDVLPAYADYNQLMDDSSTLANAASSGSLSVVSDSGEQLALATSTRPLHSLPLLFWLQVAFGMIGAMTGAIVWSVRLRSLPAALYFMTGIGYLIFAPAAAVYSTRELLIDGDLFRTLSIANHFGALFFTASLTSLLWHYPIRIGRFPIASLCYLVAALTWVSDTLQLTSTSAQFHLSVLAIFALSFVFAFFQWLGTRSKPADRAALRWFLLSIYLATGLFAGVIIIPAALGVMPPASQGVMFGAFLIMYIGLAFGITRYKLFQLERWWFSIWAWFLGGLAVIAIDLLLVSFLALSKPIALSLAVALVGWIYFPLRQWLWSKLARRRGRTIEDWLAQAMPPMVSASRTNQLGNALQQSAAAVFNPLDITETEGTLVKPAITDNGLCLQLPSPADHTVLRLHHADQGARLFTSRDIEAATLILQLYRLVEESLSAHEQGARSERDRIRQDIHDDLGAKLLTLLHRSNSTDEQKLVRDAIRDLRDLLSTMETFTLSLDEAALQWEQEARQRCDAGGVTLEWHSSLASLDTEIDQRRIADLTRIVREAVSNALRHAAPSVIRIKLSEREGSLAISVENDGLNQDKMGSHEGRGIGIIRQRATRLGGVAGIGVQQDFWWVNVRVPLQVDDRAGDPLPL